MSLLDWIMLILAGLGMFGCIGGWIFGSIVINAPKNITSEEEKWFFACCIMMIISTILSIIVQIYLK
jgi:hypothetical protein